MSSDRTRRGEISSAWSVALLSGGAGLVHIAAAFDHNGSAVTIFIVAAVVQVSAAVWVWVAPSRAALYATAAINGGAVVAWSISRAWGLSWPEDLSGNQTVGPQDLAAALLALAATVLALQAAITGRRVKGRGVSQAIVVSIAGLVLVGFVVDHGHGDPRPDQSVPLSEAGERAERLPGDEAVALLSVSARPTLGSSGDHSHGSGGGHGRGYEQPDPPAALSDDELENFSDQWSLAKDAAERLATEEAAAADGYVLSATAVPGVGAHWVKWSLVDRPFDPSQPSMLLFDTITAGRPPELVGLSYWVASANEPEGFAGPNDEWHTHEGMCFINGWLRDEGVELRGDCAGIWIDGIDLWMLHAWPVEIVDNPWGPFAAINPRLCRRQITVPDALSCDPVGR